MTSTNDGKDVKSNQTSAQKGKIYYIELYKSLDLRLNTHTTGEERTQVVCEAWRRVHSLCQHSTPKTHQHLLAWIHRHTLCTILHTDWPKAVDTTQSIEQHTWLQEAINAFIAECAEAIAQRNGCSPDWERQLLQRAHWFRTALLDPWGHPVLIALLNSQEKQLSDEEILEWLKQERAVVLVTRLRQLAASRRLRELALRLVSAVMDRARASQPAVPDAEQATDKQIPPTMESPFVAALQKEAGFKPEIWNLLTDIEFVLLHSESQSRCIELAKQTPLHKGYALVHRLQNRLETSPQDKKIWKNAKDVATLIAQVIITRCMVAPTCSGSVAPALYWCTHELVCLLPADALPATAAALAAPARTAAHLHVLAAAVSDKCQGERKSFVCELYVRAITAGMNELERLKLNTEKESEARHAEQTLSNWFKKLGSLLSASSRLSCECILTAFSVHPSQDMYNEVKKAPLLEPLHKDVQEPNLETNTEYGSWANDSRTQTNLVKTSETLNLKSERQANVLSTAIFAEGEALGLEAELCQDLAVLISGPRVKTLTWDMDRESLLANCRTYMERTHSGTRALTTELKYLNLDPRSFQHLPEEEDDENDVYYGIEKGYEHLVEIPDQDLWEDDLSYEEPQTDSSHSTGESAIDIPKRKKKSKKINYISEEEVDPLSLDDTIKPEKQDRSNSKEGRKEKKHKNKEDPLEDPLKDTDQFKEYSQEKTKEMRKKEKKRERKERKKKEKMETVKLESNIQTPYGSLSRLVGMKVERKDGTTKMVNPNLCISDSDYDSQGKSSINSEGNGPNVLFDGLFSMDEIKSPEKTVSDNIQRPMLGNEINNSNSFLLNKTIITPSASVTVIQSQKPHSLSVNTGNNSITPHQSNSVVKKNVKKLLEFRKNKELSDQERKELPPTIPHIVETKSPFNLNSYSNNLKESTNISNMPRTYLNNDEQKKFHVLTNGASNISKTYSNHDNSINVANIVSETFDKDMPAVSTMSQKINHGVADGRKVAQYSPYTIKKGLPQAIEQNIHVSDLIKQDSKPSLKPTSTNAETSCHYHFKEILEQKGAHVIKKHPTKSCANTLSQIQFQQNSLNQSMNAKRLEDPQKQYQAKTLQNVSRPVLHTNSQVQHQNFLKELRESANAGTTMKNSVSFHQILNNTVKQVTQPKKVDNAPNTFSRRHYLHKNKHYDKGIKPVSDQTKEILSMSIDDIKNLGVDYNKVMNLHTKGEIVLSKIDRAKGNNISEGTKIMMPKPEIEFIQKTTTPLNLNKEHPIMAQMLSNKESFTIKISSSNDMQNVTSTTNLSEKDQNDLLLLLRQQSKMNTKPNPMSEHQDRCLNINSNINSTMSINSNSINHSTNANNIPTGSHGSISDYSSTDNCLTNQSKVIKSDDTPKLASKQKKGRNVNASGKSSNKQTDKNIDSSKSDWESVMNALLAHKTPSRGPKALDIALKKDSFEKRLLSQTEEKPKATTSGYNSGLSANIERSNTKNNSASVKHATVNSTRNTTTRDVKPRHDKKVKVRTSKKAPTKVKDKDISNAIPNVNDPEFISDTPNSDFDLLGDLMDDDLRQEIGELLADDEAYGIPLPTPKPKDIQSNNEFFKSNVTNVVTSSKPQVDIDARKDVISHSSVGPNHHDAVQAKSNSKPAIQTQSACITTVTNRKATPRIISNEIVATPTIVKPRTQPQSSIPSKNTTHYNNNMSVSNIMNVGNNLSLLTNHNASENVSSSNNVDITNVETTHFNIKNPTPVVLVRQPTSNVLLISNELIFHPHNVTAGHHYTTNYKNSTYVTRNQNPSNITLFRKPSNPVLLESAVSVPVIQKVPSNTPVVSNVILNTQVPTYTKCDPPEILTLEKPEEKTYKKCEKPEVKLCTEQVSPSGKSKSLTNSHHINSSEPLQSNGGKCLLENVVNEEVISSFSSNKPISPPKLNPLISKTSTNITKANISQNSIVLLQQTNMISNINKGIVKVSSHIPKNQCILSDESACSFNKYSEKDSKETVLKDQLRLKQKRLRILNRQTHYYSKHNVIALLYEPIKVATQPAQVDLSKPDKVELSESNVTKDIINTPIKNENEIKDNTKSGMDKCVEIENKITDNRNQTVSCRRILLRSSNNLKDTSFTKSNQKIVFKKKSKKKDIKKNKSLEIMKLPSVAKTEDKQGENSSGSGLLENVRNTDVAEIKSNDQSVSCIDIEEQIPPSVIHNTSNKIAEKPLINQNTLMEQENTLLNIPLQETDSKTCEDHSINEVQNSMTQENNQSKFNKTSTPNESIDIDCSGLVNNKVEVKCNKNSNIQLNKNQISVQNDTSLINKPKLPAEPATESQQGLAIKRDNKTKTKKLASYKDKIIFEELPNSSNDPLKKIVRIKLPNGNNFKATISGKLNVTIDEIFEEPSVKAVILRNINHSKKCTLNIKQVTVKTSANVSTVTTHIKDISKPKDDAETINLVSDDEDNTFQTFKTEFGNFKSVYINDDMFLKHQEKISQKCIVKILRCKVLEKIMESKYTTNETPSDVEPESSFPNLIGNCIDVDDSCNDSLKMSDNINQATDMGNKENYVNDKVMENVDYHRSKNDMLLKDIRATVKNEDLLVDKTENYSDTSEEEISHHKVIPKECVIRIVRCDDLVEKMNIQRSSCFVSLVRCDNIPKLCYEIDLPNDNSLERFEEEGEERESALLQRSESLSILNDFTLFEENKSTPSSPSIIENLDIPLILSKEAHDNSTYINDLICCAEWFETKSIFREFEKNVNNQQLHGFNDVFEKEKFKPEYNSTDCESEIESIPSTTQVANEGSNQADQILESDIKKSKFDEKTTDCESDIVNNISSDHLSVIDKESHEKLKFDNKTTYSKSDVESIVQVDNESIQENCQNNNNKSSQIPSLLKIVVFFFENNNDIIDKLKSVQKDPKLSLSSPLKRKFNEKNFEKPSNKISKLEKSSCILDSCKTELEDIDLTKSAIQIGTKSDVEKEIIFKNYVTSPRKSDEILQIIEPKQHIEGQEKTEVDTQNCIKNNKDNLTCYEYNTSKDNLFDIEREKQQTNAVETRETNLLYIENLQDSLTKNMLNVINETESKNTVCSDYEIKVITDCELNNRHLISDDYFEKELLKTDENSDRLLTHRKYLNTSQQIGSEEKERPISDCQTNNDVIALPEIKNTCKIISDSVDKMSYPEIQFKSRQISAETDNHIKDFAQEEREKLHYNIAKVLSNNKSIGVENIEGGPLEYAGNKNYSSINKISLSCANDDKHTNNIDHHLSDVILARNTNKQGEINFESEFKKVRNHEESSCTHNTPVSLSLPSTISDNITKFEESPLEKTFCHYHLQNKTSIADHKLNETKRNNLLCGAFDHLLSNNELNEKEDYQNLDKDLNKNSHTNTPLKNVTLVFKGDSNVVLNGSIYEDPVIGTCYVFPIVSRSSGNNNVCDDATVKVIQDLKNKVIEDQWNHNINEVEELEVESLNVLLPKVTYSKQTKKYQLNLRNKSNRINLKRKIDQYDNKSCVKRYRKGKNIDYPKFSVSTISESAYRKEYKNLVDYWSSIKFSFSRPFHKEHIDVFDTLSCWPNLKSSIDELDGNENENLLFLEDDIYRKEPFDPLTQTLAEEISSDYIEPKSNGDEIKEINFSMGFGEGSDRVIQNSQDEDKLSKCSAGTLSDVKQCQPCLLSEDQGSKIDVIEAFKRFNTCIQLRDKVRTFFEKSTLDLKHSWIKDKFQNKNVADDCNNKSLFPYDVFSTDFIEPAPIETVVNVVQVGQLPVSAAAQNPVTFDPRVTQVTDASPQCSADNSANEDSQSPIKTEYTELTTADINLSIAREYEQQMESQESSKVPVYDENIPIKIEVSLDENNSVNEEITIKQEEQCSDESDNLQMLVNKHINNIECSFQSNDNTSLEASSNSEMTYKSMETNAEFTSQPKHQNGFPEKMDRIATAMSAAGISASPEPDVDPKTQTLVDMFSPKMCQDTQDSTTPANNFTTNSINTITLHQAFAQILPPPLNQNNSQESNQGTSNSSVTSQVLHIVQGKNANENQVTVVENTQNSVISNPNTPVLHIVQNKSGNTNSVSNSSTVHHTNSYSGLSLVDTGLQQGNQLLHIVNTGNQKNNTTGTLLKRVNLVTNLANVQGANEQKMVQFVCKSADGKSIQVNTPHQRSMVLRLQTIESPNIQSNSKTLDGQDLSPTSNNNSTMTNKESINGQHEIKSRSIYEENYAKFIQSSTNKTLPEKSTSLPKFNQAFGKQVFQDGNQKTDDINTNNSHLASMTADSENSECQPNENTLNLEHIGQISSPPILLRKSPVQTTQTQSNLVQQIKNTIAPMIHGGVIYTRQIPVNIGGGQTINLITVPSTELVEESNQKQQGDIKFVNQNDIESPIIKIVSQNLSNQNTESTSDESNNHTNENNQNPPTQHQPVLTQMRIKLPMLSKAPQMVSGARVVRPSFFQIQRNVIGGANQQVYQQLVLTAAPPLGQHTIRLPQAHIRQVKVTSDNQSSEPQMSTSTLEQLREFDMVLEQVKERSTVQPNSDNNFSKLHTSSSDKKGNSVTSTVTESSQQILYSIGANQSLNVAYVNRKPHTSATTTSAFVRSSDSSSILESPSSSTHAQIPQSVTSGSSSNEVTSQQNQPKPKSKSKSRSKSSSHPPNSLKLNSVTPKTSTQKPLEDEQTTQRILYILAEYKEQVENSPDKDKPAPRRRTNIPSNPGSSKRKKSSSGSRRSGARDSSPVQGDDTSRTMGSEDSSCGTSQGDCSENCLDTHSPQGSPRKVVRKLTFENESSSTSPPSQPQRNVIVADGQTITVARGASGKPTTTVLMPANYILPVSMVKGGQQIAIVTNRGPKLLTVGGGEGGTTNALLLQRVVGPAGLKPVLARPGVRHVRLPTAALHNLQTINLATSTTVHPPENATSPSPTTPPELTETKASSSSWTDCESQNIKPERSPSPEESEPWHLTADPNDYSYEETVTTENMERTVLDAIPDRYSPDMEPQRIYDKMFDVESKKSYIDSQDDSSHYAYDIDASDSDDKAYQVVQKKDRHRQHRLAHVAALRHKYAILEHELRLQKSLSEECEDLGVDSPSASELFPEAELLFNSSPAHDVQQHSNTPQPTIISQSVISQPDIDNHIATDHILHSEIDDQEDLGVTLGLDEGIVTVSEDGQATINLDQEEFARSHPNTTFHSEPTEEEEVQPITISNGRTIFHTGRAPATVLVTAPHTTVISQASQENIHSMKYANMEHIINSSHPHENLNLPSVLVKEDGVIKYDNILTDSRELHLSNTASTIVHATGNATQVIRRVYYEDDRRTSRYLIDEPEGLIAGVDANMVAEDSPIDTNHVSIPNGDEDNSLQERNTELFWESNSTSERSESRRPVDYNSSDSEKCCKSPYYETNSTDSSGVGAHVRLDSVIKEARLVDRGGSGSSDDHPPLRTYPAKRMYHNPDVDGERSLSGKTSAGFQESCEDRSDSLEIRRRASGRGVVKRNCSCCNGSPAPRPKKPKKKPTLDFNN